MKPNFDSLNNRGCPRRLPHLTALALGAAVLLGALFTGRPAAAQDFTFQAEPAVALWVDEPHSSRFTPGVYLALRPGLALNRVVGLQWSYALLYAPAGDGFADSGTAHFLSAGLRLRPFGALQPKPNHLGGLFWDLNAGYVRTGDLDRFGFDTGLGYGFQVARTFAIGPVIRYAQIIQSDNTPNEDPNDAQFVTLGLNLSFGPAHEEPKPEYIDRECPAQKKCDDCPECVQERCTLGCPDGDHDGTCDPDDRCPTVVGPPATLGCPIDPCGGAPLVVLVQFNYNSSSLPSVRGDDPQTMDPVLDEVAKAVLQDPSCRVCIIGHASEEGPAEYNRNLSLQRASAVQGYMVDRGLSESRMPTAGLGSACQLVPETTRLLNRRVEFRRLAEGESCPTDCSH